MAEREALFDAVFVRRMDPGRTGQSAPSFRIFRLQQVALAGAGAQNFSAGSNLKSFSGGFLGFDAFWPSHKINQLFSKRARNIRGMEERSKG